MLNPTLTIQNPNRIHCCNNNENEGILRDICGRITKCCRSNCQAPTAISFGYENDNEMKSEEELLPTVSSDNAFFIESSGVRSFNVRQSGVIWLNHSLNSIQV